MAGDIYGQYGALQNAWRSGQQNNQALYPQQFPTMGDQRPGRTALGAAPQQGQGTQAPQQPAQSGAIQQARQSQPQQQQATAAAPTFRQMQMQGQARPAPAPVAPPAPTTPSQGGYPGQPAIQPMPQDPYDNGGGYGVPGGFYGGYPGGGSFGFQYGGFGPPPGYQPPTGPSPQDWQQYVPQVAPIQLPGAPSLSGPVDSQTNSALNDLLTNKPTAYDDATIQGMAAAQREGIDQQAKLAQQQVNEEMARRGLFSSTPAAGKLGDIESNRLLALADMNNNLLNQRAAAADAGRQAGISGGLAAQNNRAMQSLDAQRNALQGAGLQQQGNLAQAQMQYGAGQNALDRATQQAMFGANLANQRWQFGGQLGLNYAQLQQQGNQFNQNFGLAQNAQNWNQLQDFYNQYGGSNLAQTGYDPYAALQDLYGGPGGAVQPQYPPVNMGYSYGG